MGRGTRGRRRFDVRPRSLLTWPIAWLMARVFLPRAVARHDAAVRAATAAVPAAAPGTAG